MQFFTKIINVRDLCVEKAKDDRKFRKKKIDVHFLRTSIIYPKKKYSRIHYISMRSDFDFWKHTCQVEYDVFRDLVQYNFSIFSAHIRGMINNYLVPFRVTPIRYSTLMTNRCHSRSTSETLFLLSPTAPVSILLLSTQS